MQDNNLQPKNNEKLKTVRTYLSDMADTVRENEISVIKVAMAEQKKREVEDLYLKEEGTPMSKTLWIVGSIILIIGASLGSYFLIQKKIQNSKPVQISKVETVISYDELYPVNLSDEDILVSKLISARKYANTSNKENSIKYIPLTKDVSGVKQNISNKEFFDRISSTAPSSFVRSLSSSYMIGTYKKDYSLNNKANLFLIFQINDYSYAYAGMLEWEKTIAKDMYDLFEFNTNKNRLQVTENKFKDIIMWNKDARIIYNENGTPMLYYIFVDNNNLVITDSGDAIKEIIDRINIKNIKPL